MRCADEKGWPEHTFFEQTGAPGDFACGYCGWLQETFGQGLRELVCCGTWHSMTDFNEFRDKAISEGVDPVTLPEFPPEHDFPVTLTIYEHDLRAVLDVVGKEVSELAKTGRQTCLPDAELVLDTALLAIETTGAP